MAFPTHTDIEVFYKMQCNVFKFFGLWPPPIDLKLRWQFAHHLYFLHILVFWLGLFDLCCLIQLISNISSLNEIIKVFFIFATALSVMAKFLSIKLKNHDAIDILHIMHSEDFQPANCHEREIFRSAMKLSRTNRNIYFGLSLAALNLVLGTQFIIDSTELPLSIYIPISTEKTVPYISVYLFQYIAVSICCLTNIGFDLFASSLFIYLKGQLGILGNRLQYLGCHANGTASHTDDVMINMQLCDCMRFYERIRDLCHQIENIVSTPMSMQIVCSVLVLIANFYAIAFLTEPGDYANFIKCVTYQLCMLTQIFILCYFSNEVSLQSVELSYALYSSNWMYWGKVNRRLALLMMLRFDTPIRIKTLNRCYSFNLAAFTSIVNSSYSYFALLKNMNS